MANTVLLVDDDRSLLEGLARNLQREGLLVLIADDTAMAMEVLNRKPVDVVVADDRMPGVSGVDFLAQIRHLFPDTARIVLSGHTDPASLLHAVNEGEVFRFLVKPCPAQTVAEAIRQAIDHRLLLGRGRQALAMLRQCTALIRQLAQRDPARFASEVIELARSAPAEAAGGGGRSILQELAAEFERGSDVLDALEPKPRA